MSNKRQNLKERKPNKSIGTNNLKVTRQWINRHGNSILGRRCINKVSVLRHSTEDIRQKTEDSKVALKKAKTISCFLIILWKLLLPSQLSKGCAVANRLPAENQRSWGIFLAHVFSMCAPLSVYSSAYVRKNLNY